MFNFGDVSYIKRKKVVTVGHNHTIKSETIRVCDGETIFNASIEDIHESQYMLGDYISYETNMGRQTALFVKVSHPDEWLCEVLRTDTGKLDTAHIDDIVLLKGTPVC